MTDPGRWLDDRDPPAPAGVREAIDRLVAECGAAEALHDRLADAAFLGLERVVGAPSVRSTAPLLLAADALLTYACEAAAEAGPEALERLTHRLSFERFSQLVDS